MNDKQLKHLEYLTNRQKERLKAIDVLSKAKEHDYEPYYNEYYILYDAICAVYKTQEEAQELCAMFLSFIDKIIGTRLEQVAEFTPLNLAIELDKLKD